MVTVEQVPGPVSGPVTRRAPVQERSRRRVEAILDAAERLVVERGVEALTTREIAARRRRSRSPRSTSTSPTRRPSCSPSPSATWPRWTSRSPPTSPRWPRPAAHPGLARRDRDAGLREGLRAAPRLRRDLPARSHQHRRCTPSVASTTSASPRTLRELALESGLARPTSPSRSSVLAVEVGDRVFQLAYEHDPHGDQAIVDEGIALMTAYLDRYARSRGMSARDDVAAACRRLAAEGLLVGTAGNVEHAGARPGRRHGHRRRARRLPGPRRRARRPRRHPRRRRARADVRARPAPRRVRRPARRRRGRAHPRSLVDRRRLRARRASGPALPAAAARRRGPRGAVRHLRLGRARRPRARGARGPAGRADGQPRLGRRRRDASTRPSSTPCCSSGSPPCTTVPRPSARPACSPTPSRRTSSSPPSPATTEPSQEKP